MRRDVTGSAPGIESELLPVTRLNDYDFLHRTEGRKEVAESVTCHVTTKQ